jgi:AcrR family transcriptional regulator
MDVTERRAQLLQVGCELFANRPYDEVWIDHVAEKAGVSRGLLYHYFNNKRGFLHAIVERETAAILEATRHDDRLPPVERLRGSLDAYLDYVATHPHGYRALFQGAPATDSEVRALVRANLERQERRILDALTQGGPPAERLRIVVHGWLAFIIAVALDWLDRPVLDAHEVRDLCVDALTCALTPAGWRG